MSDDQPSTIYFYLFEHVTPHENMQGVMLFKFCINGHLLGETFTPIFFTRFTYAMVLARLMLVTLSEYVN